jgi:hypothetical protein
MIWTINHWMVIRTTSHWMVILNLVVVTPILYFDELVSEQ